MRVNVTIAPAAAVWLFMLTIAGISYGSLYPFEFHWKAIPIGAALEHMRVDWRGHWSRGNMIANVVLFVPYALFGMAVLAARPWWLRWCILLGTGASLAFGLQVLQLWLPARVSDFGDAVLNMGGLVLGGVLAHAWTRFARARTLDTDALLALPVLLMGCWIAYKWAPFVPTLDWYTIKQGLKPLFVEPRLEPLVVFRNLVCWLVFASLWHDCRLSSRWLWGVIPGVVLAQIGIAYNPLALDSMIGALLAPGIWVLLRRIAKRPQAIVLGLLVVLIVIQGLWPFTLGRSSFHWLLFHGFLTGSMFVNLLSLLVKLYLYGAVVWLVLRASDAMWAALVVPVLLTGLVEIAQTRVAGRVAEITDTLLCVLVWGMLWLSRPRPPAPGAQRVDP